MGMLLSIHNLFRHPLLSMLLLSLLPRADTLLALCITLLRAVHLVLVFEVLPRFLYRRIRPLRSCIAWQGFAHGE